MNEEPRITLQEAQRKFAKSIYNGIWELLEKEDRTPSEDEDLLLSAYASLYHWKMIGTVVNLQRGYWMLSRVYQTLGQAEQALQWALKCQKLTVENPSEMEDFDLAFAREGLARAFAIAGNLDQAKENHDLAAELGKEIADPQDQLVFMKDFNSGNWYDLPLE